MLEQGKSHGGIPDCIELSPDEAMMLIDEINAVSSDHDAQLHRYKFVTDNDIDARLSFRSNRLTDEQKLNIVADWTKRRMNVSFDGVPLRVIIVADCNKKYHEVNDG